MNSRAFINSWTVVWVPTGCTATNDCGGGSVDEAGADGGVVLFVLPVGGRPDRLGAIFN